MPTISQNITYVGRQYVRPNKNHIIHYAVVLLVIIVIALALECLLFNMNFFRSLGQDEVSLNNKINLSVDSDGSYVLTEANHAVEFKDLDVNASNIYIGLDKEQSAKLVSFKINFTDDAHETYFDTTEYTVGIPDVNVSSASEATKYVNLATSGKIHSLRIEVVEDSSSYSDEAVSYPIKVKAISLNKSRPFNFVVWRFLLAIVVLILIYAFRPKSSLYRKQISETPVLSKVVVVCSMCIEMILVTAYLLFGANLVGVATENYNQGDWNGVSFANTFEVGGDNAQQYAYLARAMAHGQLYLDVQPPDWLVNMDNPYDKGARDELQKQTGEESLHDVAFKDGKYYVYFGVVPEVMFYLPFYLITGSDFPSAIGVLIALLAFIAGCTLLLDRFARYHFKRVSLGIYLLLQIPLVMCCGILYLAKFPTFYAIPISCGLAFSVWGLYFWMKARGSENRYGWFLAGSLCMALVAGCRPQMLLFSLLVFPLFWREYITKRRILTRKGALEIACMVAPYVIVAAGIMGYNYARFGSFTDFGANYNLTVNDMTKRGMNAGRILPALFAFFIQPPNVSGVFPYLQEVVFQTTYMGQTIRELTYGGVLVCLPVLWVLFFSVPIIKLRIKQRSTRTVAGVIAILIGSAVVIAVLDAEMAGILQRYFADFSFMMLLAVVLLIFVMNENLSDGGALKANLTKVLLTTVAISVTYSLLICFVGETGWYSDVYGWAYQDFLKNMMFWT